MAQIEPEEVRLALLGQLGDKSVIDFDRGPGGGRIVGWIMTPRFQGLSHEVRRSWLWEGVGINGKLPSWTGLSKLFGEQGDQIGMVLTFAPAEYENAFGEAARTA